MIRNANLTLSISRSAGGLFDSIRRSVQTLAPIGLDSRVYGVRDEFTDADISAWAPIPVLAFDPSGPAQFGYSPRFVEELTAYRPDVVHTHGIWVYPSMATQRYCRRMRTPYMISPHGMMDVWAVRNSRLKKAIAHFLFEGAHLRGARCLRALCQAEAEGIHQWRLGNDIVIIPNGVDLPTALPGVPAPWSTRVEFGKKVLLYLSRLHPKKGLPNLIQAWPRSQAGQCGDWVLAIAGWDQGGHERELKDLATGAGIPWTDIRRDAAPSETAGKSPSVVFLGPQFGEGKAACYHHCDAFVLPSFSEGLPMVVLDAWVHAKPVVMTPHCNLPEGFTSNAAVKVDPTAPSLVNGLNNLCRLTDAERLAMGMRGYRLAEKQFVWPRVAEQIKAVYEWMLGGGARPACVANF